MATLTPETVNGLFAVGGAIVGALVSGLFAMYLARKGRKRSGLTLLASRPIRLLAVGQEVADQIDIIVGGERVEDLFMVDVTALNSGNQPLKNLEIPFSFTDAGKIVSYAFLEADFEVDDPDEAVQLVTDSRIVVSVDFLNPGERVTVRIFCTEKTTDWGSPFRRPGVSLIKKDDVEGTVPDVVLRSFFDAISKSFILDNYFKLLSPQYKAYRKHSVGSD